MRTKEVAQWGIRGCHGDLKQALDSLPGLLVAVLRAGGHGLACVLQHIAALGRREKQEAIEGHQTDEETMKHEQAPPPSRNSTIIKRGMITVGDQTTSKPGPILLSRAILAN